MKKIALFSLMLVLGLVGNSFAGKGCVIQNCKGKGNDCLGAYDFSFKAEGSQSEAYICETGECGDGTVILSPDLEKAFICEIAAGWNNFAGFGDDKWSSYIDKINWCDDEQIRMLRNKDIRGNWLYNSTSDLHRKKTIVNTTEIEYYSKNDSGNAVVFSSKNLCFAWTCEYGFHVSADGKSCEEDSAHATPSGDCQADEERATKNISITGMCTGAECTPIVNGQCYKKKYLRCMEAIDEKKETKITWNGQDCVCTDDKKEFDYDSKQCVAKNKSTGKTCKELYGKYPERLACCEAGKDTKWTGSVKDGTCSCVDKTKDWDSAKKQCVARQNDDNSEYSDCYYNYDVNIRCANGNTYHERGSELLKKSQLNGLNCADFNSRFEKDDRKWQELYGDLCKDSVQNLPDGPSTTELSNAVSKLEAFTKTAESNKSVWKDSEGKFNTARLASDLTAGVVLGTVGGVVSGVVIKKKQIEKGFDVLHCAVGGQKVADWGDTFSVGFRR